MITTEAEQTIVAVEAKTITLGSIELVVYRPTQTGAEPVTFPGGEVYRLSKSQILDAIEVPRNWLSRLPQHTPKALEVIREKGFTGYTLRASVQLERGATQADTLSVKDAVAVWGWFAKRQNDRACDILEACAQEAIERRADLAFGIFKTTEQYEQRLTEDLGERRALREDLKKGRHKVLMSAIIGWEKQHGIYGTPQGQEWFRQTMDTLNLKIQGMPASSIRELHNVKDSVSIRDLFDARTLVNYSALCQGAAGLLKSNPELNPVMAVEEACKLYLGADYKPEPLHLETPLT